MLHEGQRLVQDEQARVSRRLGLPGDTHLRQFAREAVMQDDVYLRCNTHAIQTTDSRSLADGCSNGVACAVEHRREGSHYEIQLG